MQVKILFDKDSLNKKLLIGWGVSYLIDGRVLFDAGEKPDPLFNNIKHMKIDISCLESVVISHDHWDHTGGLWELLNAKKGLKVYGCPNFSKELKNRGREFKSAFIEADKVTKVREKIYTTGEISGEYKKEYMPEQALVIETDKGISVITGCAHPGIIKILEQVKKNFNNKNFYMVFGGFHLMNKDKRVINLIADEFKKLGVQKAGPSHCSGPEAEEIFRNKYKDDFVEIKVGQTIEV